MKGLQDVVDEERKDWGEQLALLKETNKALEDLESARKQIGSLTQQVDVLRQQIVSLKHELQSQNTTAAENATAAATAEAEQKKRLGGIMAVLEEARTNSNIAALASIVCAVLLVVSVGVSCWTWHRVNESTGNLYTLIQSQSQK